MSVAQQEFNKSCAWQCSSKLIDRSWDKLRKGIRNTDTEVIFPRPILLMGGGVAANGPWSTGSLAHIQLLRSIETGEYYRTCQQCVSQDLKTGGLFFGTWLDRNRNMQSQRDFAQSVYQSKIKNYKKFCQPYFALIQNPKSVDQWSDIIAMVSPFLHICRC